MHAGGYLDQSVKTASPSRLAIVVALHGAAIATLMLAKPEVIPNVDWTTLTIDNIKAELPPPEAPPPAPPPQTEKQTVDRPDIIVPTSVPSGPISFPPSLPDGGSTIVPMRELPPAPVTIEARFLRGVEIQPDYPTSLARQEIEGAVTVRMLIGTDGRVKEVQQISATEPDFFTATKRQALRHWRFTPATRDGVAVESWREMTVRFKLEA